MILFRSRVISVRNHSYWEATCGDTWEIFTIWKLEAISRRRSSTAIHVIRNFTTRMIWLNTWKCIIQRRSTNVTPAIEHFYPWLGQPGKKIFLNFFIILKEECECLPKVHCFHSHRIYTLHLISVWIKLNLPFMEHTQ